MWKLILVLAIWLAPNPAPSDSIILIADDCTKWGKIDPYRKSARYSIVKSTTDFHSIMLIHDWMLTEDSLSKINMHYADIMEHNPRYTSELNADDWIKLDTEKRKIYLLRPDDYCTSESALSLIKNLPCMKYVWACPVKSREPTKSLEKKE